MYMVGTPWKTFTFSLDIRSIAACAGEPGQQHEGRAEAEGAVHADGLAERVEQRQAAQHDVVRRASLASKTLTVAFITRLRWLSTAPLGCPVVPLVKKMTAGSSAYRVT